MNRTGATIAAGYFGKIPSRGDFIKASAHPALINTLDAWLAQAMELLSADARWKLTYDALAPLQFAFIGPQRGRAVAGHIVASSDQSRRRYPFLMMSMLEVADPAAFVPNSPLVLARLWQHLGALSGAVLAAPEPTAALHDAATSVIELDLRSAEWDAAFNDFLLRETVGGLEARLVQAGFGGTVRQLMLALGLLLHPVMSAHSSRLEKSLVLPLPDEAPYRDLAGALWMHLITPFLLRGDFELALFITRLDGKPALVLGFSGASALTLQAIMDPAIGAGHHIAFDQLDWVDDQIATDFAIKKISTYLAQPGLSLKSACDCVRAAFSGT